LRLQIGLRLRGWLGLLPQGALLAELLPLHSPIV